MLLVHSQLDDRDLVFSGFDSSEDLYSLAFSFPHSCRRPCVFGSDSSFQLQSLKLLLVLEVAVFVIA